MLKKSFKAALSGLSALLPKAPTLTGAYNRGVSGSANCVRLDPNPRLLARTSDTRQPLYEIIGENDKRALGIKMEEKNNMVKKYD